MGNAKPQKPAEHIIAARQRLELCPDNRITGGKIHSVRTRDVKRRVAEALGLVAQSLWQVKNYFGDLCARRAALKTRAVQTLREVRPPTTIAKRLECG